MKIMAYPASHFMTTSSEFVTIHSLNPNQSTLLTRVDLKETVNIHKVPLNEELKILLERMRMRNKYAPLFSEQGCKWTGCLSWIDRPPLLLHRLPRFHVACSKLGNEVNN